MAGAVKDAGYFGTGESLDAGLHLQAGKLACLFEKGNLRYIRLGKIEILRMIYGAVRDENWMTIGSNIRIDKMIINRDSFSITYHSLYHFEDIQFQARFRLEGFGDNHIRVSMEGQALHSFRRNRIGMCVLHPIRECAGRNCIITQPDGTQYEKVFPSSISAQQPFTNIQSMNWTTAEGVEIKLELDGDIFETEDQRNWSDDSYKTYSTPLHLPFPVLLETGDSVYQTVDLKVKLPDQLPEEDSKPAIIIGPPSKPFPAIGYQYLPENPLTEKQRLWLRNIPLHHLRVDITFEPEWKDKLEEAAILAAALHTRLELAIIFQSDYNLPPLLKELARHRQLIYSIFFQRSREKATGHDGWNHFIKPIHQVLPDVPIGAGSNRYFTEWNRYGFWDERINFISFPINPQVHATDIRTMIENLEALDDIIDTASLKNPYASIHISPVTLRSRQDPDPDGHKKYDAPDGWPWTADRRQDSLFTAAWTAVCLSGLSGASLVTIFECQGRKGLMEGEKVFPVYLLLQEINNFNPARILRAQSSNPVVFQGLCLEDANKNILLILCNFSETPRQTSLQFSEHKSVKLAGKILVQNELENYLADPGLFLQKPYQPLVTDQSKQLLLPPCSIQFIRSVSI